jgi:hypothetical protein
VARQAGEEPEPAQARKLLDVAEEWLRLAESEDADPERKINASPSTSDLKNE